MRVFHGQRDCTIASAPAKAARPVLCSRSMTLRRTSSGASWTRASGRQEVSTRRIIVCNVSHSRVCHPVSCCGSQVRAAREVLRLANLHSRNVPLLRTTCGSVLLCQPIPFRFLPLRCTRRCDARRAGAERGERRAGHLRRWGSATWRRGRQRTKAAAAGMCGLGSPRLSC